MMNLHKAHNISGANLLKTLIDRSWDEPEFKNQLIEYPMETIENLVGYKMKSDFGREIVVVDQTDRNTIYFNIPPIENDIELNERDLEMIVGGGPGKDFGVWLANKIEDGIDYINELDIPDMPWYLPSY